MPQDRTSGASPRQRGSRARAPNGGLAAVVRARRQAAGLTQQQLAALADISVAVLRDLEQGRTSRPRAESVAQLARVLGLNQAQARQLGWAAQGTAATVDGRPPDAGPPVGQPVGSGVADAVAGSLRLRILGPLAAWRDGVWVELSEPKQRAVLGVLALHPNTPLHREALIDAVWEEDPPATAVNLVQAYVSRLRRMLDPGRPPHDPGGLLVSAGTSYQLRATAGQLDLVAFRQLADRARAARDAGELAAACSLYQQALGLWRGAPLADVDLLRGHPVVVGVAGEQAAVIVEYAEVTTEAGVAEQVLPHLQTLVRREPLNERAHALLMLALAGGGQQAAALAVYEDLRGRLDEQLGVAPGPELTDAHLRVLRQQVPTTDRPARWIQVAPVQVASARVVPRQLPAAVRHFAGRADELNALCELLDHTQTGGVGGAVGISAIGGTAGVGKSALAVRWAHQVADRFPDGQLYVNLRGFDPSGTPVTAADAVRGFLDAFHVSLEHIPTSVDAQAGLYRSLLAGRRVLVVLDNARDEPQVRPLLPGSPGCLAVVTSRNQLSGLVAVEGARPLTLDLLSHAEAWELLARRLGQDRVAAQPHAVGEIIARCARLPLALAIVAARAAAHPDFPLAAVAAELSEVQGSFDALGGDDVATDLRAVFSWSYQTLRPDAARLFRLLGLHPGPDITVPAAASLAGTSARPTRSLLTDLACGHLVTQHTPGRYAFHDLLRAYATELARTHDPEVEWHAALHRVLDHYLHTAHAAALMLEPYRDPVTLAPAQVGVTPEVLVDHGQTLGWFTAEHPVLLAAIRRAADAGFDTHTWQLAWTLTSFLHWQGHWHDWAATQQAALDAARRLADRPAQAVAHRLLGRAHLRLDRLDEARIHLRQALELFGELGNRDGQARTHHDLAIMFERQTRYREALGQAQQALDLHRATGHRVWQARALNAVGWYHALLGDHRRALTSCRRALTLHQELGDRQGEADTWDSLGYAHRHLGHHARAVIRYQHALDLRRKIGDRLGEANTLDNLGLVFCQQGCYQQAADHHHQALALYRELGDRDDEARALDHLGLVDQRLGRHRQAADHHRQALAIFRDIGDRSGHAAGHPQQAGAPHRRARTLASHIDDRYQQARAHHGLAQAHHATGDLDQARHHWQRALALFTDLGVPDADQVRAKLASLDAAIHGPRRR